MSDHEGSRGRDTEAQRFDRVHLWQVQAVRDVLVVAAAVALVWAGYALRAVTVPLLTALLLAYLCEPLIARLAAVPRIGRMRAVTGVLLAAILVFLLALAIAVPMLVTQTLALSDAVAQGHMRNRMLRIEAQAPEIMRPQIRRIAEMLPVGPVGLAYDDAEDAASAPGRDGDDRRGDPSDAPDADGAGAAVRPTREAPALDEAALSRLIDERVHAALRHAAPEQKRDWLTLVRSGSELVTQVVGGAVRIGLVLFLIPFYFWFFSVWYPGILEFGHSLVPRANRARWMQLLERMDRVIAGFVRGRILISFLMGAGFALGWVLCGVPYAVVLGLVTGVFCAVPYLGIVGLPMAIGLLFMDQLALPEEMRMAWWGILLWPSLVFVVVQTVESYWLTPAIAGKATNLDPVTVLVAVLAGGSVMGVYGMLLAIPVAACGKILLTDVFMPRIRAWLAGRASDPLPFDRE